MKPAAMKLCNLMSLSKCPSPHPEKTNYFNIEQFSPLLFFFFLTTLPGILGHYILATL